MSALLFSLCRFSFLLRDCRVWGRGRGKVESGIKTTLSLPPFLLSTRSLRCETLTLWLTKTLVTLITRLFIFEINTGYENVGLGSLRFQLLLRIRRISLMALGIFTSSRWEYIWFWIIQSGDDGIYFFLLDFPKFLCPSTLILFFCYNLFTNREEMYEYGMIRVAESSVKCLKYFIFKWRKMFLLNLSLRRHRFINSFCSSNDFLQSCEK